MTSMQTSPEELLREIRGFLARVFRDGDARGLDPKTPLVSSGIVDSTGVLEVVEFLERRFSIQIDDQDVRLENFDTLLGLTTLVSLKQGSPEG